MIYVTQSPNQGIAIHNRGSLLKVAVIGAGCAGLMAAHDLKDAGISVTVFDKGRGVGGRCATRHTQWGAIDHGVQLLSQSDPKIAALVAKFSIPIEDVSFNVGDYQPIVGPGPFIRPIGGAQSFAAAIATGMEVKTSHTVTRAWREQTGWQLACTDATFGPYDAIILAIPPAQAKAFGLHGDALSLDREFYSPQVAALIASETPLEVPDTGPLNHDGLAWISTSRDRKRATVLSAQPLSSDLMETDKDEIAALLWSRLSGQAVPNYLKGHRWRYCRVETPVGKPCHWDTAQKTGFCGDWFIGPNVEHALTSGSAMAAAVLG